jgi:hypothetical protein
MVSSVGAEHNAAAPRGYVLPASEPLVPQMFARRQQGQLRTRGAALPGSVALTRAAWPAPAVVAAGCTVRADGGRGRGAHEQEGAGQQPQRHHGAPAAPWLAAVPPGRCHRRQGALLRRLCVNWVPARGANWPQATTDSDDPHMLMSTRSRYVPAGFSTGTQLARV